MTRKKGSQRRLLRVVSTGIAIASVTLFAVLTYARSHRVANEEPQSTHEEVLFAKAKEIVSRYRTFGATTVDRAQTQELGVAPELCAPPDVPTKPTASTVNDTWRIDDRDTPLHGRKIYALYAKDALSFRLAPTNEQPVGQAVVKEAWSPKEVNVGGKPTGDRDLVHYQGKAYTRGEARGLFLLFKVDPATPGTDNGWVYATTAADHSTITACGLLPTCFDCHNRGGKDRLFGPVGN